MKTQLMLGAALLAGACVLPAHADELVFGDCLAGLRGQAAVAGVSGDSFDTHTRDLAPDMGVLELLDAQPEFTTPIWDYLAALVDEQRISDGQAMLESAMRPTLAQVSQQYGVDPATVVAVWGVESDYGKTFGKRPLLVSLATLSCFGRRQEFFRGEFFATLKLLQSGDLKPEGLTGSWAGAFGHTQFMPSTYQRIAVDGDGDGRRDLVASIPDALASTANYLKQAGWRTGEPWGYEVKLPAGFRCRARRQEEQASVVRLDRARRDAHRRQLSIPRRRCAGGRAVAGGREWTGIPGVPQLRRDLFLQRRRKLCAGHRHFVRSPARRRTAGHAVADRRSGPGPWRTQTIADPVARARPCHRRSRRHDRHVDPARDRGRTAAAGHAAAGWARGDARSSMRCASRGHPCCRHLDARGAACRTEL